MSILQYLTTYAEVECGCPPPTKNYDQVLVIPAFDEQPSMLEHLFSQHLSSSLQVLCIIVVNASQSRSQAELERTQYLLSALTTGSQALGMSGFYLSPRSFGDIVVVDKVSPGRALPTKQGVGLARKIGCDLALAWHHQGIIKSPWIHSSDADAILPDNYFSASDALSSQLDIAALCYPFWHNTHKASRRGRALEFYEMSLRYYVLGLAWAGSPYAFHTIGSTIAIRTRAYYQVRGFPKRLAGEDFYLLNKAAKVGNIVTPASKPVRISQRESARTPFGTGPATQKINTLLEQGESFCVYHPKSFALLREWLGVLHEFAETCNLNILESLSHPELKAALPLDTEKQLRIAKTQCKTSTARKQRLMQWFDGFRTLKLMHALRDQGLHDQVWNLAFDAAPFVPHGNNPTEIRQAMTDKEASLSR